MRWSNQPKGQPINMITPFHLSVTTLRLASVHSFVRRPWRILAILFSAVVSFPESAVAADLLAGSLNSGGGEASSAAYAVESSLGEVIGGQSAGGGVTLNSGGSSVQPTGAKSLTLGATSSPVNEGGTMELAGSALMDDDSVTLLSGTDIVWSIVGGPIMAISPSGLATTGAVYANTLASIAGGWMGADSTISVPVINSLPDNFRSYAGDGLPDDWQVQYFGQEDPHAGPSLDPDGDGQDNGFEFTAGLVPTDGASRFLVRVIPVQGHPDWKQVVFEPVVNGRNYVVKTSTDLSASSWAALTGIASDFGGQRTVTDTSATEGRKFYRVEIVKP